MRKVKMSILAVIAVYMMLISIVVFCDRTPQPEGVSSKTTNGGSEKTDWITIYIELPEGEATEYFENRFGISPHNVTCRCCGSDFSVHEAYEEPTEGSGTLIIREADIKKTNQYN